MTTVKISNTKVVAGKSYEIPVNVTGFPTDVCSFEIIIQTEPQLFELDGISVVGTMIDGKMAFCNNGVEVPGWVTPYSKGKMIVVCADALPLKGKVMFKIVGKAVDTGTAVFTATYLLLNTNCLFGKRPELTKLP